LAAGGNAQVNVEFVEPFVRAGFLVIETVLKSRPTRGTLSMRRMHATTQQVTIEIGVDGIVSGNVLYGMSMTTAQKIASVMIGQPVVTMDEMAWSAISELANIITGRATQLLNDEGDECNITPPNLIKGWNVEISIAVPALVVPMLTMFGRLEINAALYEAEQAQAA
jgi:chemotaxis protein CheX